VRSPAETFRALFVGLLALSALAGCARSRSSFQDIYRDENIQVRLVEQKDASGDTIPRGFDHPWAVDAETLQRLLASIQYQRGVLVQRSKVRDVFPADVRERLLEPLRKAFEQAGPDQAVDFSFLRRETTLAVFQREYLTDGVLFRKEGAFHCALRNLAFETLGGPEAGENPFTGDPTENPLRTDWNLVLKEGQSLARSSSSGLFAKKEFPNWIVLDLVRFGAQGESARPETTGAAAGVGVGAAVPGAVLAPSAEREPSAPVAAPALQAPSAPSSQPTALPPEVEERLRFLDELHQEGALSDEAYAQKNGNSWSGVPRGNASPALSRASDRLPAPFEGLLIESVGAPRAFGTTCTERRDRDELNRVQSQCSRSEICSP